MGLSITSVLSIVSAVVQYAPQVTGVFNEAISNDDVVTKLEKIAPGIAPLIQSIGAEFFPKASPTLQTIAGIVAGFDPNTAKWLQTSLNTLVKPPLSPPLVVDGLVGAKTIAAVKLVQAQLGLKQVDGIAGKLTQAAIDFALSNLPVLPTAAPAPTA